MSKSDLYHGLPLDLIDSILADELRWLSRERASQSQEKDDDCEVEDETEQRTTRIRGGIYTVIGCPPEADSFRDHFNRTAELITFVRWYMQKGLLEELEGGQPSPDEGLDDESKEIVIADLALVINMLRHRTFPAATFFSTYGSSSNALALSEAKIIGERERFMIEAIQDWLISTGQVRPKQRKRPVLMSEQVTQGDLRELYEKLFCLTGPDDFLAMYKFPHRDPSFISRLWETLPASFKLLRPHEEVQNDPVKIDSFEARNIVAYLLFQDAYVLDRGGRKISCRGEEVNDRRTRDCLPLADALDLDQISRNVRFAYPADPEMAKIKFPYRAARFGTKNSFDVMGLGGFGKIKNLETHLAKVMTDYFPIFELFLKRIRDSDLPDLPVDAFRAPEAVDYLRHMLARKNDGSVCQEALDAADLGIDFDPALLDVPPRHPEQVKEIEAFFDRLRLNNPFGFYAISDPVSDLREIVSREDTGLNKALKSDILRVEIMKLLSEMAAAIASQNDLKTLFQVSGIQTVLSGEVPISDLMEDDKISSLSEGEILIAKILWLRAKIEKLKVKWRNYDYQSEEQSSIWQSLIQSQRELFDLLQLLKNFSQKDRRFGPELYLIERMEKILESALPLTSKIRFYLADFFQRVRKILQP